MAAQDSGVLVIKNLPHGFYEQQLLGFFSQFGKVECVRVKRSRVSGRSCGVGYVRFEFPEVASIAGKSMDNYAMFGVALRCCVESVEWERARPNLFRPCNSAENIERIGRYGFVEEKDKRLQKRKERAAKGSQLTSRELYLKRCQKMVTNDRALAKKLKRAGLDYTYPPLKMNESMLTEWKQYKETKRQVSVNTEKMELAESNQEESAESSDEAE